MALARGARAYVIIELDADSSVTNVATGGIEHRLAAYLVALMRAIAVDPA